MASPTLPASLALQIGTAQIDLQNVQLRENVVVDEVHLEGGDIRLEPPAAEDTPPRVTAGETRFRAVLSEMNLNRALASLLPPEAPIRNLRAALLSGRVRLTGQYVKVFSIPVTIEGVPRIENGVRVYLDWEAAKVGFTLPAPIREVVEQSLNRTLVLSKAPIPVWLDELRCEPGRLTALGKAHIFWPPVPVTTPAPFSAYEAFPIGEAGRDALAATTPPPALPEGTEETGSAPAAHALPQEERAGEDEPAEP